MIILDKMRESLQHMFGENYEFQGSSERPDSLIVKWPEVTIKNRSGRTHNMKDLYMRIGLSFSNDSCNLMGELMGCRGVLTQREYHSDYAHSHLNSKNGFSAFCLGSSRLQTIIGELAMNGFNEHSIEKFQMFLFMLQELAEWESLAGTPYRKIQDIRSKSSRASARASNHPTNVERRDAVDTFNSRCRRYMRDNNTLPFPVTINLVAMRVTVQYNQVMEELLQMSTSRRQVMDSLGNYYDPDYVVAPRPARAPSHNSSFLDFIFKGDVVHQQILSPAQATVSGEPRFKDRDKEHFAHSTIRTEVIKFLERKMNERLRNYLIKKQTKSADNGYKKRKRRERQRKASNKFAAIFEDSIFVPTD